MGDWKHFDPAAFQRKYEDGESARNQVKFEHVLSESMNGISNLGKEGGELRRFYLAHRCPRDVLKRVRAHLVDGNPALAPYLCIQDDALYYDRVGCGNPLVNFFRALK